MRHRCKVNGYADENGGDLRLCAVPSLRRSGLWRRFQRQFLARHSTLQCRDVLLVPGCSESKPEVVLGSTKRHVGAGRGEAHLRSSVQQRAGIAWYRSSGKGSDVYTSRQSESNDCSSRTLPGHSRAQVFHRIDIGPGHPELRGEGNRSAPGTVLPSSARIRHGNGGLSGKGWIPPAFGVHSAGAFDVLTFPMQLVPHRSFVVRNMVRIAEVHW